jgi:hypothetical protein
MEYEAAREALVALVASKADYTVNFRRDETFLQQGPAGSHLSALPLQRQCSNATSSGLPNESYSDATSKVESLNPGAAGVNLLAENESHSSPPGLQTSSSPSLLAMPLADATASATGSPATALNKIGTSY